MMRQTTFLYKDQETELEGFAAYSSEEKRPLVLLCHAWRGRDEFICEKALELAREGYAAFALDMYGKGVLGRSKEENAALKRPFLVDRTFLLRRVSKGLEVACDLPFVDSKAVACLGFGFGALCALDLARSGADMRGAVSIYGHFDPPKGLPQREIKAKILVLHGYLDSVSPMSELVIFQKEMDHAGVDWQCHLFGEAHHAFATPSANDPTSGILYHPLSAQRAWFQAKDFLREILY